MPDLLKFSDIQDTAMCWLPRLRRSSFFIYWLIIVFVVAGFISLFLFHVAIYVRAPGVVRPFNERTEIRAPANGIIDSIYYKEGDRVEANHLLITISDPAVPGRKKLYEEEMAVLKLYIHDLEILTNSDDISPQIVRRLQHPLYQQQALKYLSGEDEQQLNLAKAQHETKLNELLEKEKVISPKEFYDIKTQEQKTLSVTQIFHREQYAAWQSDLAKYKSEMERTLSDQNGLEGQLETSRIRVPISGHLQELHGRYAKCPVQTGELLCAISPDSLLTAECYVGTGDIAMLREGQEVRFQVDAFDYNYYGFVTGKIYSVGNDFMLVNNTPVFKIICQFDQQKMNFSKGFRGELKKGMRLQARFIAGERTLWQLLFDHVDKLFNPTRLEF